jgi:hypothetical protein
VRIEFLTELRIVHLDGKSWRTLAEFRAAVLAPDDRPRRMLTVPEGYETDFASVPRAPFAYWLTGNTAHKSALLHDYLYTLGEPGGRGFADSVFLAAMLAEGVPWWRRRLMYAAVRAAGGSRYGKGVA